ncbi:MAG: hypothetical protein ACUVYA_03570 [Planctomycetota bacterium]
MHSGSYTSSGVTYTVPYPWWWTRAAGPSADMRPARFFLDSVETDLAITEKDQVKDLFADRFR